METISHYENFALILFGCFVSNLVFQQKAIFILFLVSWTILCLLLGVYEINI